jgi:type IV pilus assembly protein PilQ
VRETQQKLEEIRRLVGTWDVPVRQVSIEARIVRAQTNVAENLGVRWGGAAYNVSGNDVVSIGGSLGTLQEARDAAAGGSGAISFPGALGVDLGVSGDGASSFAIGWGSDDFLIDLELSALETDGRAEVVSQPRVVTADRQSASIKSGEEIPYQEATSSGATNVEFKEAVLSLEVTPQITPDDKIIMDLVVNQDSRGEVTAGIPSINTNSVTTQVLVANGETVVLGGIFQSEVATQTTKTPFLGDIPYLGRLFKRTEHIDERSELLIFITPKIIKNDLIQ